MNTDEKCTCNTIYTFDNIYWSIKKCSKGVKWKKTTAHFLLNHLEETYKLKRDVDSSKYKERPSNIFKVYEPKEREVISINFRDRVYQKILTDYQVHSLMTKSLIYDNCASQKNKGTDFARERFKKHLHDFYNEYRDNKGYIIHIDIKKYYPHMCHESAENCFKNKLFRYPETLDRVEKCLKMYEVRNQNNGYYAGSQIIQIAGICILDSVDHYIKEQLKIKYYDRYMDDLMLIVRDNSSKYISEITNKLKELKFELNEDKTCVKSLYKGEIFLGFKFSMSDTGRVYMCISTKNLKRARRKCAVRNEESFKTWYSHASKSTSKKHIKEIKDKYETISKAKFK